VRARGFTLLEVVIAFALLAGILVVSLRLFSEGSAGVARAERRTLALLHAESKLAEMLATQARPAELKGEFPDGYRWWVSLVPAAERARGAPPPPVETLVLTVTVAAPGDGAARGVSLDTLHLVPAPRS
jgi:general secretion pathway protein I